MHRSPDHSGLFLLHLSMLKVGLTGGIGAGKSVVARIFEVLGIPVYQADIAAKKGMENDPLLMQAIKDIFSEQAYIDGKLNRKFIADIVFNDKEKLKALNAVVHPYTIQDGLNWMNAQKTPYAIKEAALIFESGSQGEFDHIIGVFAPVSIRVNRTIKRDHTSREAILERIENQIEDRIKMKLCDDVIINDEQHPIIPQVLAIHEKLLKLSGAQ